MNIKRVDKDLVTLAKLAAIRNGVTLRDWVIEVLKEALHEGRYRGPIPAGETAIPQLPYQPDQSAGEQVPRGREAFEGVSPTLAAGTERTAERDPETGAPELIEAKASAFKEVMPNAGRWATPLPTNSALAGDHRAAETTSDIPDELTEEQ